MQITTFRNADLGITIHITMPAQKLMGTHNVPQVVVTLTDMLTSLCANGAYVAKRGSALEITAFRRDGWTGTMKLKR